MVCVLAEAERRYGAHGIPFFTLSCSLVNGKKEIKFPTGWQRGDPKKPRNKNAVCVRTGFTHDAPISLVVVDADGHAAIATFEALARRAGVDLALVPQVQTQRGSSGRHYYFRASPDTFASTLRSTAKIVVDGAQTSIDVRAGTNGEGVGCILAPPTVVTGGGAYTLVDGPAVHEAPAMPDSLAALLGAQHSRLSPTPTATTNIAASSGSAISAEKLCAAAVRDAKIRARADNIGTPLRVVRESDGRSVRVEFTHRGTRVCPVSHEEHRSNHFNITLRLDERTGLPALFVYCHSEKEGCKAAGQRMLSFLDAVEAADVCAEAGLDAAHATMAPPTLGQAAVAIGEAQKSLDRLLENPNGPWAAVENLIVVACALCTAAGGHSCLVTTASLMLAAVLDSTSSVTGAERGLVERAFQMARVTMDPLVTLRGFAEGLNGKREQELMVIREAIVACTDASLEADVGKAADAMLEVLEFQEYRDESTGRVEKLGNITDLGLFIYHIWWRVARYGFDKTQSSESHQWTLYLFNGATYERGQWKALKRQAKHHFHSCIMQLCESPSLRSRAKGTLARCKQSDFVTKALAEAVECMQDGKLLREGGLVSPDEFERELDMGNYVGFKNGVYDILSDRFLPKGRVPLNVVVSMCTNYDYIPPDDLRFPEMRAQIEEFYRKLHADNYEDPNDERLAAMWLLSGSLLFRGNVCKKAYVFLGSEGDNGKSTFTELIQLTLGDYAVTGNRSSLSGTHEQMTLDPDLVANCKSLVCTFPEVQSVENGVSAGFKFNCGKLKALTGQDEQSCRGLYRDKRGIIIGFKPILHSNFMPVVDTLDSAARDRLWVARFGATFPAGLTDPDLVRRRFPRIENLRGAMKQWAPFHFLLMLEALRDFRRRNCVLPPGAQQIEGSLMHQAAVAQTPEGKLRAWVEESYTHLPLREKDSGTKLEVLYAAYTAASPPLHSKVLGKILFGKMLNAVYPHIGPHRNTNSSAWIYLLR
jgi:hypothetical protein